MKRLPFLCMLGLLLAFPAAHGLAKGKDKEKDKSKTSTPVPFKRDWTANPAVVEVDTKATVYAIGDVHGDPVTLAHVLFTGGLMSPETTTPGDVHWSAADGVLVMPGDMIDKGSQSLAVIALLQALKADATSKGGQVIITMGNHEAEYLPNPTGDKTSEFQQEMAKAPAPLQQAVTTFLCNLPIAARVNDWFFCHGGNTDGRDIATLKSDIQSGVDGPDGFATQQLVGDNSILEARLNKKGPGKMPWFFNGKSDTVPQQLLAGYVKALGVNHIVQGHQYEKVEIPGTGGVKRPEGAIAQAYGLLFLIDGGMSNAIQKSKGGTLKITGAPGNQQAEVICPSGTSTVIWSSNGQGVPAQQMCCQ